jgi:RNA polymerase sigma-70 factor, ECF subfamily
VSRSRPWSSLHRREDLSTSTDDELVAAFRAGRDEAFSELVRRYEEPLLRYARRRLRGTAHDPEDVVQDCLACAYTALRRDDRPMLLRPWLYAIVRNRIVDSLRAPSHGQLHDAIALGDETLDDVLGRCNLAELVSSVADLPLRQRRALVLCAFEGRPYRAIAAELDISVSATKALIARARAGVRNGRLADAA